ncbi:M24 family metallopeptidase [Conexibacter sp. JD483]|uniref:M24 family metallopeptidase n=1 Tax=unclassified Conexibacter TaxID=2627773 RepID=UPI0027273915|nr:MULTISPECIES: M24 family metallopeptidase [unclassified Conexibacter]MDO8189139.1 M24 family metallopeptidase [Conexibacter sp. CPCC 205706]MDO8201843.1 M24 family metallopeptidase [Conexibacter sp. CPCC 205762]MDR9371847.1 M24 family metallopeptidase [Conexibacter sp. JD483]
MNVPDSLAFDLAEYADRRARVRERMAARGIDALYVSSPANVLWLTGYEASWYPPRLPLGCALRADTEQLLFLDWSRHVDYVRLNALYDELITFEYGEAAAVATRELGRRGWLGGTIALEWTAPSPVAAELRGLEQALTAAGAEVVAGDWLVDGARLFKSPAELERVRRAGEIADDAFRALAPRLRAGMSELEVGALITTLLAERGSEVAAQPALVSSGPGAWCDTHAFPSTRALSEPDVVCVDACAVVDRYHVNLSRTFAVGTPSALAAELLDHAAGALPALCRSARAGEGPEGAMALAEAHVRERIAAERIWWVGGYALGLALPPSWVGHAYLANDGPERIALQDGWTSNFETILYDRDEGFEVAAIDTVVMDGGTLAPLSAIPRMLLRAGEQVPA